MPTLLSADLKRRLVEEALAATAKAYLTKEGGVRYGAAVLTADGGVFSSGQYSSFNHSTNVHAEQAALLIATASGCPDVAALAVASTGREEFTRPCGVCRQVMLEHAQRTGRDFPVLMVASDGGCWQEASVTSLLPHNWLPDWTAVSGTAASALRPPLPEPSFQESPASSGEWYPGDQMMLPSGLIAMVWDAAPWPGHHLVKVKYRRKPDGWWEKLPHAHSQPYDYERALAELPIDSVAPCGARVATIPAGSPACPFRAQPLPLTDLPGVVGGLVAEAGLSHSVFLGGSRALGLDLPTSDHDLIIRGSPESIRRLHSLLAENMRAGRIGVPPGSGTWRTLDRIYPGGMPAIIRDGRFAQTLSCEGRNLSLMFTTDTVCVPLHGNKASPLGHRTLAGTVATDAGVLNKRAAFSLHAPGLTSREVAVRSFHKAANLVRTGDRLALRGWLVEEDGALSLLQFHPHRDNLVWLPSPLSRP